MEALEYKSGFISYILKPSATSKPNIDQLLINPQTYQPQIHLSNDYWPTNQDFT